MLGWRCRRVCNSGNWKKPVVRIKRVNFREYIWAFCWNKRSCPLYTGVRKAEFHCTLNEVAIINHGWEPRAGLMNARGCLLSVGTSCWRDKRKDNCGECYCKLGQFYRRRVACHYPNLMELFPKTVWCSSGTMFLELEEYGLLWKFNLR